MITVLQASKRDRYPKKNSYKLHTDIMKKIKFNKYTHRVLPFLFIIIIDFDYSKAENELLRG